MFFLSCKNNIPVIKIENSTTIKLDIVNSKSQEVKSIINEIGLPQIITFKGKDSSFFIASIKKLIIFNNDYFVLDDRFSNLTRFDSSGNFISSYGNVGLGKNEFSKISDFDIDTLNKRVVIMSTENTSLFYYTLSGSFIKRINTGIFGTNFCILPQNEIIIYRNFSAGTKGKDFNIALLDSTGAQMGKSFSFDSKISDVAWLSTGFLKNYNGEALFANAFSDTIYKFTNQSFKPFIEINITSGKIKTNNIFHRRLLSQNILIDSAASFLGPQFFRNNDFVVFNYQQNSKFKTSIFNTKKNTFLTILPNSKSDPFISFFLTPIFLDNQNTLFCKFDMKNVLALKKKDPELFNKLPEKDRELLNNKNENSGAFMLKIKINENQF
jgi:hypothetical protein